MNTILSETGERVSVITQPKSNIMVVAPHGFDDSFTSEICFEICKTIDCNLVTNNGFQRSNYVDTLNDKANCNNIKHCKNPVVYQEFLQPIMDFAGRYKKNSIVCFVHGLGIKLQKDFVIGYGLGADEKNRLTIDENYAENIYCLLETMGFSVAFGKGGGKYAGYSNTNLNQLFNKEGFDVKALQIEISSSLRKDLADAISIGNRIAPILEQYDNVPVGFISECFRYV